MRSKVQSYLIIALTVIIILLFFRGCILQDKLISEQARADIALYNLTDSVKSFYDKSRSLTEYNKALRVSLDDLTSSNSVLKQKLKDLQMKKPDVIIEVVTEIDHDTIQVPFEVQLPCKEFTQTWEVDSPFFKIEGILTRDKLTLTKLELENTSQIIVGERKTGWLLNRKNEYIITVQNSNPYFRTTGLQSYTITEKKKWYESGWIKVGVGFAAGALLFR